MSGWRGLQRGNFDDPRVRRNWNRLSTLFENLLNGDQFELGPNGELQLAGGVTERFAAYDATGNLEITDQPQTVPYDTETVNTDSSIFSFSGGELTLTLTTSGNFMITATVSVEHRNPSDTSFQCEVWVEKNTGTGWVQVPGSVVHVGSEDT